MVDADHRDIFPDNNVLIAPRGFKVSIIGTEPEEASAVAAPGFQLYVFVGPSEWAARRAKENRIAREHFVFVDTADPDAGIAKILSREGPGVTIVYPTEHLRAVTALALPRLCAVLELLVAKGAVEIIDMWPDARAWPTGM